MLPTECSLGRILGVPCDGLISVPTNLSHARVVWACDKFVGGFLDFFFLG